MEITVPVSNAVPSVEAGADQVVLVGEAVTLSGSYTDAGVTDTHTVLWDFGDGFASTRLDTSYTFGGVGEYEVWLHVTDDEGGTGSDSLTVRVVTDITAEVADRHVFYNNSILDGADPSANAADDAAIDPAKALLLPGQSHSSAHIIGYSKGINGVMIDVENLADPAGLMPADVAVRVSDPSGGGWLTGPAVAELAVRVGAGVGGSDRVTLTWADGAIIDRWVEVTLQPVAATGLAEPDVMRLGHLSGDFNGSGTVDVGDLGILAANWANADVGVGGADVNLDGTVDVGDLGVLAAAWGAELPTMSWGAEVVARHLFYNNSSLDGGDPGASADDDAAIDPAKAVVTAGESAGAEHVSGSSKGVNGVMIDVAGLADPAGLSTGDVQVRVSDPLDADNWLAGPAPSEVAVRVGDGVGGSDRITLIWPDGTIADRWLEVTLLATPQTGLADPEVMWLGQLVGDANGDRTVDVGDLGILASGFGSAGGGVSGGDFNLDGTVDVGDLGVLAASWQHTLADLPAGSPATAGVSTTSGGQSLPVSQDVVSANVDDDLDLLDILAPWQD
jgi:hypothetical protein